MCSLPKKIKLNIFQDACPKIPAGHSLSDSTADRKVSPASKLKKLTPPRPQSEPDDLGTRTCPNPLDFIPSADIIPNFVKSGGVPGKYVH